MDLDSLIVRMIKLLVLLVMSIHTVEHLVMFFKLGALL